VRWIETQHLFFTSLQVERLIEVGPAPTLLTMAKRTLEQGNYSPLLQREILWYNRDKQAIYYQHVDEAAEQQQAPTPAPAPAQAKQQPKVTAAAAAAAPAAPAPAAPAVQQPAAPRAAAPAGKSVSAPLTALDVLRTMLALKLKRSLPLVPPTTSIREAVGGKSALQNELIGDVAKEFGSEPEGAADMDLTYVL
jgi:fatty acid synthase subunit alpha